MKITNFKDRYRFLSNFYPSVIVWRRISFPTLEHAFQAAKSNIKSERLKISKLSTAKEAKAAGKKILLRQDWEIVKFEIMFELLKIKFKNKKLQAQLIDTENIFLIEGNWWHDNIWGDCSCKRCENITGENMLGKLLMKLRNELRND